jgi:hypothetical protein
VSKSHKVNAIGDNPVEALQIEERGKEKDEFQVEFILEDCHGETGVHDSEPSPLVEMLL